MPRSPRGAASATSQRRLLAAERREQALRLAGLGASCPQIGARLGVSRQAAWKMVKTALVQRERAAVDEYVELQLVRIHAVIAGLAAAGGTSGDAAKANAIINASKREAELLGLDAPARTDLTIGTEVGKVLIGVDLGALARGEDPTATCGDLSEGVDDDSRATRHTGQE